MSNQVQYTGHGQNTGGLQGHSIGDEYPYMVAGVIDGFAVLDTRTGTMGAHRHTYREAEIDLHSLKIRNLMHS